MKYIVSLLLVSLLTLQPLQAIAQSPSCSNISDSTYDFCCLNPLRDVDTRACYEFETNRLNPPDFTQSATKPATYNSSINLGSAGGSFSGVRVAGLGATILGCTGISDVISGAVTNAQTSIKKKLSTALGNVSFLGINFGKILGGDIQEVKDTKLQFKEGCLDNAARTLAQQALAQMTQKTLNWVNTGFDGNPLYVRDINSYLTSVRNQGLAKILPTTASNPIFGNAIRSTLNKQITGKTDGLLNKAMNTPEAKAYRAFNSDFTAGGWGALLNTANNPLSAFFSAADTVNRNLAVQQQQVEQELSRNNGFLDMKKCVQTTTNGCARYETITPGALIASQLAAVTSSPIRQAEAADELNEAIGSFFDSLLNKLFSKNNGLAVLKGGGGANFGGTALGANSSSNPTGYDSAFNSPEFAIGSNQQFDISRPQQVRAVLQAQYAFLNRTKDATIAGTRVLPLIARLDYCLPGPNPIWQNGVSDNVESLLSFVNYNPTGPVGGEADALIMPFSVADPVTGTTKGVTTRSGVLNEPYFNNKENNKKAVFGKKIVVNENLKDSRGNDMDSSEGTIRDYLHRVLQTLTRELTTTYNITTVPNAFALTGVNSAEQTYNRGVATTAYRASTELVPYAQYIAEMTADTSQRQEDVGANIAELETINTEVQALVKVAKARYIASRAAAGNPVDRACIDKAYVIDQTTIPVPKRLESDTQDPSITAVQQANDYFNSTL